YTFFVFFFQAEDGIRDFHVTGVQTCALPICWLQQRPASPALLVALARLARQQEQWPQARDFLQRALEQGAGADAWELLGDGLAEAGEHALAAQAYANALLASRGEPVQPLPAALVEAAPDIDPDVRDANGLPRLLE